MLPIVKHFNELNYSGFRYRRIIESHVILYFVRQTGEAAL